MKLAIEKSHEMFPYTNIESSGEFVTPNWVKFLNY